ncbi:ABC transporter permease [Gammaproteobacteria bacterium AS21]
MHSISWFALLWCFIPLAITCFIYVYWAISIKEIIIASSRMLIQLVAVGYVLIAMFNNPSIWLTLLVLVVMISAAAWISVRPVRHHQGYLKPALISLLIAVSFYLTISIKLILDVQVWYLPKVMIPLAGMYFANTMNAISLAAERFHASMHEHKNPIQARNSAFKSAMIPQVNSLLAVGLVTLPGMMTGQILSDISPLIAVRYQIMIMTMLFGASSLGTALMLSQLGRKFTQHSKQADTH